MEHDQTRTLVIACCECFSLGRPCRPLRAPLGNVDRQNGRQPAELLDLLERSNRSPAEQSRTMGYIPRPAGATTPRIAN